MVLIIILVLYTSLKETYGDTPKLIRKRNSPTSHSINHSQLVEIDKNIIELFDDTNQSSSSMRKIDIPFEPTKRSQMYQPKTSILKEVILLDGLLYY